MNNSRSKKHEKFLQLAESRVNKVTNSFLSLGKLSNKQNYEYTRDEAFQIIKHLKNELSLLETLFLKKDENAHFKFNKRKP